MAGEEISEGVIVITADTSQYERALELSPKAAEKAADLAGRAADRAIAKAAAAARRAIDAANDAAAAQAVAAEEGSKAAIRAAEKASARQVKAATAAQKAQQSAAVAVQASWQATATAQTKAAEHAAAEQAKAAERAAAANATAASKFGAAAKSLQQSSIISEAETISALFIQMGGNVSRVASVFTSLIRPVATVTTAFGPMGIAIAAIGVAAAAVPLGVSKLVAAAIEAQGRLEALNVTIDKGANQDLKAYQRATTELGIATDKLTASIGSQLAPVLTTLTQAVTGALQEFNRIYAATESWRNNLETGLRVAVAAVSLGLSELTLAGLDWAASTAEAEVRTSTLISSMWDLAQAAEAARMEMEAKQDETEGARQEAMAAKAAAEARKAEAEAARKAADARREDAENVKDILATLAQVLRADEIKAENAQKAADEAQKEWEYRNRINAVISGLNLMQEELNAKTEAYVGSWREARNVIDGIFGDEGMQNALRFTNAIADTTNSILGDLQTLAGYQIDALREKDQERVERAREHNAEVRRDAEAEVRRQLELGVITDRLAQEKLQQIADQEAANNQAAEERDTAAKQEAKKLFERQKAYQIAQATIHAATSAIALIPALSFLAFGAPIAAAGLAGAALATQIAVINGQQPPEFPTGLSPDHHAVAIQAGEPVLSRRANAQLDRVLGPDASERLNAGQSVAAGGGTTNIYLGRKLLASVVESSMGRQIDRRTGKRRRRG